MTDDGIFTHGASRKFSKGEEAAASNKVVTKVFHSAADSEISNRDGRIGGEV